MTRYRLSNSAIILRAIWAVAGADLAARFSCGLDKVRANLRIGNRLTAQFPLLRNASEPPPLAALDTYVGLLRPSRVWLFVGIAYKGNACVGIILLNLGKRKTHVRYIIII